MALKVKPATSPGIATISPRAVVAHGSAQTLIPGFGNITTADMVVPRLKLLQGLSPEVKDNPRENVQGEWYHTIEGGVLGQTLHVIPLQVQRTIELWAPRDDDRGLLARSVDGIHWDKPHEVFEVRIDNKKVVWKLLGSVGESGLAEFGTSKPGDPKSAPAAALTYRLALYLLDHEHLSPCLYIASRMATRGVQDLMTRIQARHMAKTPFWAQKYRLDSMSVKKGPNDFFSPSFKNDGNLTDPETIAQMQAMAESMATMNLRSDDERLDENTMDAARAANKAY